jgi:prolyl oligopeptidase
MAARMLEQGHDVLYFENIEGGHGGASNNEQRANLVALENTFWWVNLGGALKICLACCVRKPPSA